MGKFGMGQPIRRVEDERFLKGFGEYTDDIKLSDQTYLVVHRSPYAHAKIKSIDLSYAKETDGVLGVFVNKDLEEEGFLCIPHDVVPNGIDGNEVMVPKRPILAQDKVRYVGEPIAIIVAKTLNIARDASELIEIDFEELTPFPNMNTEISSNSEPIFKEIKDNELVHWSMGNKGETDKIFSKARKIISINLINNRIAPTALEPRAVISEYDNLNDSYTLRTGSQGSHKLREWITGKNGKKAADIKPDKLRVICPDVGGGFGMKNFLFNETLLTLFASKAVGKPVKWKADRTESFLNDTHGRDQINFAELALSEDGKFEALRVSSKGNVGAYVSQFGAMIPTMAGCGMLCGCYKIKSAYVDVKVIITNTTPLDAYRGAGRPESAYIIERLVDKAADELKMDRAEIRKLNFIEPEEFPFETALGMKYDSGEYKKILSLATKRANWNTFAERREESEKRGMLRGIGMSYYIEACGGGPTEFKTIAIKIDGRVIISSGSQNNGQGHETAFAQIAADTLGIEMDKIEVIMGDTEKIEAGIGTGGSRALAAGGSATLSTCQKLINKGKSIAATLLQSSEDKIIFENGFYKIMDTGSTVSLLDVAKATYDKKTFSEDIEEGLETSSEQVMNAQTFPNGCHICEIEIDPETGVISFINYIIEDDIGRILNPLMLEGQILGGAGQGIGQALYEEAVYDNNGQLVNGSFMDYIMPRADNLPSFNFNYTEVSSPSNKLGVKGAGEAGTIGATPAVANAVINALNSINAKPIDMPMTPIKIWKSIKEARKS